MALLVRIVALAEIHNLVASVTEQPCQRGFIWERFRLVFQYVGRMGIPSCQLRDSGRNEDRAERVYKFWSHIRRQHDEVH